MGLSEYLVTFYSIFVGFAASSYIVGWGNIIKNFGENKPYWGQLVWSTAFFSLMLNDWWVSYRYLSDMVLHPMNLLSMLYQPTLVYFISILIFPDKPTENHREHFEKHKRAILILAMFIIAKIYWESDPSLWVFNSTRRDTSIFFVLVGIGIWVRKAWYAELLGTLAMLFWIWRFWVLG